MNETTITNEIITAKLVDLYEYQIEKDKPKLVWVFQIEEEEGKKTIWKNSHFGNEKGLKILHKELAMLNANMDNYKELIQKDIKIQIGESNGFQTIYIKGYGEGEEAVEDFEIEIEDDILVETPQSMIENDIEELFTIRDLQKQISALTKRVKELESVAPVGLDILRSLCALQEEKKYRKGN